MCPVGGVRRVMVDLRLHEPRLVPAGLRDRLLVGVLDNAVDHDGERDGRGVQARVGGRGFPGAERVGLPLEIADRVAHRRQAQPGHDARAVRATDGAVEVQTPGPGRGPYPDRLRRGHVRARVAERLAGHPVPDDVPRLGEALPGLAHVQAERVVLELRRSAPEAEVQGLVGELGQHRDLAREPQRVVPRGDDHAGPEAQFRVPPRQVRDEQGRVGSREVVAEMVLEHPRGAVAELRVELAVGQHAAVEIGVARAGGAGRGDHASELDASACCHADLRQRAAHDRPPQSTGPLV